MLSQIALILNTALVFWLFRRDMRLRELPSSALWIPAIWLVIIGSRTVTQWLAAFGINVSGTTNEEGNPLDMVVFIGLMVASVVVLGRRNFDWPAFVRANKVLIAIYLYCALSALWAEYSLPTLKRALKDFGNILVALVLLSELDPMQAIRIVYVRVCYLLLPLSVVLIKYFPAIGRMPDRSHNTMFIGATTHKNALGRTCFHTVGLFVIVDLMEMWQQRDWQQKKDEWITLRHVGRWPLALIQLR